jgi:1-phosphatidylinositol-3-phosphate 5-kinase
MGCAYLTSDAGEHVFPDSLIIVREDEPSSVIAFTLNSKDYIDKLDSMYLQIAQERSFTAESTAQSSDIEMESYSISGDAPSRTSISESDRASIAGPLMDVEETLLRGSGTHIKYRTDGGTRLNCTVFFAEQFDALRRHCGCSNTFVESLTRCASWDALGGKSGSSFLKTRGINKRING